METKDEVQLIHAVLSGDDSAFGILVEKYQDSIHALAWQKVGDFHYAEEITQDTFLKAYQNLLTLKDPNLFSNWLYKIATNCCRDWLNKQKRKTQSQSLEVTPMAEVARSNYDRYVSEQREAEATEHRFEVVKKLLDKLPEGERKVMVLYYLGEMTTEEVGKFLGVSVETIRTRLHRARKRLQDEEELLLQEVLGGVQIPSSLSQNIMRRVADMKPTPPSTMKPFLPWAVIGAALVVAALFFLSVSNLIYFARNDEDTIDKKGFAADFSVTLGTHRTGAALLEALLEAECSVSRWSRQALENPDFPVVAEEIMVDIVVVSMLEMGFAEGELATVDTIYERAKQMGLETCPVETAAQLRLQFRDQPDYSSGARLGEFLVASEPFVLAHDIIPKIFTVVRDDNFSQFETGIGLWLISNDTLDVKDRELPDRLFNASDPDGDDYGGRFAFVLPR